MDQTEWIKEDYLKFKKSVEEYNKSIKIPCYEAHFWITVGEIEYDFAVNVALDNWLTEPQVGDAILVSDCFKKPNNIQEGIKIKWVMTPENIEYPTWELDEMWGEITDRHLSGKELIILHAEFNDD